MTLLIKNGLVFGDLGDEPVRGDIFVRGDRILRLGKFSRDAADMTVDAAGAFVLPGLIDVSTDFDHYFGPFSAALQGEYVKRGITTVLGGGFGISIAPFSKELHGFVYRPRDFSLGSVGWHTVGELLTALSRQKMFLNFGTLLGYESLKARFVGERARDLSEREYFALLRFVRRAFYDGVFGVSMNLATPFVKRALREEFFRMAEETTRAKRVLSLYLGDDIHLCEDIDFVARIAEETGANIQVCDAHPRILDLKNCSSLKKLLTEDGRSLHVSFDFSPNDNRAFPIFKFLPVSMQGLSLRTALTMLKNGRCDEEIFHHLKEFKLGEARVGFVPHHLKYLIGKTVAELAATREMDERRMVIEIMKISGLQAVMVQKEASKLSMESIFGEYNNFIFSGNGLIGAHDEYGIQEIFKAADCGGVSLRNFIEKASFRPAKKFGIVSRGRVKEGFFADLVIAGRDGRVEMTIVNGKPVFENGKLLNPGAGKVMRHL